MVWYGIVSRVWYCEMLEFVICWVGFILRCDILYLRKGKGREGEGREEKRREGK